MIKINPCNGIGCLMGAILLIVAGYIGAIEIAKIRFFREGRSQAQATEGISAR